MSEAEIVVSAGGVIYRTVGKEFEVALILHDGLWCLPKGLIEENETHETAALREVKEETGLTGEIAGKIGEINYNFFRKRLYSKTVHFYLLKYVEGSIDAHDTEADDVKWFNISRALQILAYPNERKMLLGAKNMLKH